MKIYYSTINGGYYFDLEDKILIVSKINRIQAKVHLETLQQATSLQKTLLLQEDFKTYWFSLVEDQNRIQSLRALVFAELFKEILPEVLLTSSNSILRKIAREENFLIEIFNVIKLQTDYMQLAYGGGKPISKNVGVIREILDVL